MSGHETKIDRAVPLARWIAYKEGIPLSKVEGSGPRGIILPRDLERFKTRLPSAATGPRLQKGGVSSLAKRLAEKRGIPLERVKGTGNRGRIMMGDVLKALETSPPSFRGEKMVGRTLPMSKMRKVIARRMSQSAFTAPHIYFFTDVDMDALDRYRQNVLPEFEKRYKVRISMNDLLISAVALTLREYPLLNASLRGEEIVVMPEINVGLAVALEEGLIVPAIPGADKLGLEKIALLRTDLVERARTGTLKLEEIERGTFTISSLAQFDITFFTAILNPPQSGILSVGKTSEQLALKDGKIALKKSARFGLSVDHRIIDGVLAATFLQSLKHRLEKPPFAGVPL